MKHTVLSAVGELTVLHSGESCGLYLPAKPHIKPHDGGHLMVIPHRSVDERSKLSPFEALELTFLSIVGGKILESQHGAAWINYQENGNWKLDTGKETILHLHVYGRSKTAQSQPYGEALSFPLRRDLETWHVEPYTPAEIDADIGKAADITQEDWTARFRKALETLRH
jgi:diadenosine tetraphosphate (Ap4A) HIT family hydrolase